MSETNATRIIRRAALEMQNTDDIVKLAGIVGTVRDMVAALMGGKTKQEREELQQQGSRLTSLLEAAQNSVGQYLEAIRGADVKNIDALKEQVQQAVKDLGRELGTFDRSVDNFVDQIPLGVMNDEGKVTSEKDVAEVLKHPSTDPELYKSLVEALPPKLLESLPDGRPMRGIRIPFKDFPWMHQFEPQHISISTKVRENILNTIKDVLASPTIRENGHGPVPYKNQLKRLVDDQADDIIRAFRHGVLGNGYMIDYYWPAAGSSQKIKRQPANQMMMTVHGGKIALKDPRHPESAPLYVEFPTVLIRDLMASLAPSKKLSVRGVKNVRLVTAPQEMFVERVEPVSGLMDDLEESEQKMEQGPYETPSPEATPPEEEASPEADPTQNIDDVVTAYKDVEKTSPGYWAELRPQIEELAKNPDATVEIPPAMAGWSQQDYQAFIDAMDAPPVEEEPSAPVPPPEEEKTARHRQLELLSLAYNMHQEARNTIQSAFNKMWPDAPLSAIQATQAVAGLESSYGKGWSAAKGGKGSNNWGAVHSTYPTERSTGKKGVHWQDENPDKGAFDCPAGTFLRTDGNPAGRRYWVCFKKYDSPVHGAMGLIANIFFSKHKNRGKMLKNWAMTNGSIYDFSTIMRETYYYGGRGNKEQAIRGHVAAMKRWLDKFTVALGESPAVPIGNQQDIPMVVAKYSGEQPPTQQLQPMQTQQQPQQVAQKNEQQAANEDAMAVIPSLYNAYVSAGRLEKMIRTAVEEDILPVTRTLISFDPEVPLYLRVRFAHVLSSALDEEVGADTSLHYGEGTVQIECDVRGSEEPVTMAVFGISEGVSAAFEMATGTYVKTAVCPDCKSAYGVLESDISDESFRKFAMHMMGRNHG